MKRRLLNGVKRVVAFLIVVSYTAPPTRVVFTHSEEQVFGRSLRRVQVYVIPKRVVGILLTAIPRETRCQSSVAPGFPQSP